MSANVGYCDGVLCVRKYEILLYSLPTSMGTSYIEAPFSVGGGRCDVGGGNGDAIEYLICPSVNSFRAKAYSHLTQ